MKDYLIIFLICFTSLSMNAQGILNPGFESVQNTPPSTLNFPDNWKLYTGGDYCEIYPIQSVASNESYTGDWCIRMETTENCMWEYSPPIPGSFRTKTNVAPYFGHPYTERPDYFHFYYKFHREGLDTGYVSVMLFNYDDSPDIPYMEGIDTIAFGTGYFYEQVEAYTEYVIPINYFSNGTPTYVSIAFNTSKFMGEKDYDTYYYTMDWDLIGTDGTTLWVDDLSFTGGTVSISESYKDPEINIFPNPTSGSFQIEIPEGIEIQNISLSDYHGREIRSFQRAASSFSMDGLPAGIYLLKIQTNEGTAVRRIVNE